MESLKVTIKVWERHYVIDAIFRLFNSGQTSTQWVGHLVCPDNPNRSHSYYAGNLEAWINGESTVFASARGCGPGSDYETDTGPSSLWIVKEVTFAAQSVTTIRIRYQGSFHSLHTGFYAFRHSGYWKNSIGRVTIIADTTEVPETKRVRFSFPSSYPIRHLTEKVIRIEEKNVHWLRPSHRNDISFWHQNH